MKQANAVRLVGTKDMSREQWLAVRNRGIGSSDAAAAIGLSPYKSPLELWHEKTGRIQVPDLSEKEAVFWGSTLEPVIANVYQERTGQKVRRVNAVLQHPEVPFMLANLDRSVGGDGILEIKTAGYHSVSSWEETVPEAYQCQVLHQLAVSGKAWADVAVLIAGQDFRIYRIERDDAKIADLIEQESRFWEFVQRDTPPPPDGSESSARALSWMYPRDAGETVDFSEHSELNQMFHTLLDLKQKRRQLEFMEETHRQTLQSAMGNASSAVFLGGKVSWKTTKDSTSVDTKRLVADHPDLAAQYTSTTPGQRRFLLQVEKQANPAT